MFRRPTRSEWIEMFVLAVAAAAMIVGLGSRLLTHTQLAFVAGAYGMWLVWCAVADWRMWSVRRKLTRVTEQSQ
jgi:hypothetical protein